METPVIRIIGQLLQKSMLKLARWRAEVGGRGVSVLKLAGYRRKGVRMWWRRHGIGLLKREQGGF
jgi:hypothetical protein